MHVLFGLLDDCDMALEETGTSSPIFFKVSIKQAICDVHASTMPHWVGNLVYFIWGKFKFDSWSSLCGIDSFPTVAQMDGRAPPWGKSSHRME